MFKNIYVVMEYAEHGELFDYIVQKYGHHS